MNLNIESLGMKGIINNGDVNNKSIIGVVMQQMAKVSADDRELTISVQWNSTAN